MKDMTSREILDAIDRAMHKVAARFANEAVEALHRDEPQSAPTPRTPTRAVRVDARSDA